MKDLSDMLEKENIGVSLSSKIINALKYADDVALIAESESELRKRLKISHDFACKWNLKFNDSKSKVLMVVQRINKNRKWQLRWASDDRSHMEQPMCNTWAYY
jgi:hypothetical protein